MSNDTPIIVSACLAGLATRYDGTAFPHPEVLELVRQGRAIPVCPEQLGGLPTPRTGREIVDGRVVTKDGEDSTAAFEHGANEALKLTRLAGCNKAILKARSPSCGSGQIYDGTFSGKLIPGNGVFAAKLKAEGFEIVSEEDLDKD
jgi:uncharacterized protein YbbK (DUF523 family)